MAKGIVTYIDGKNVGIATDDGISVVNLRVATITVDGISAKCSELKNGDKIVTTGADFEASSARIARKATPPAAPAEEDEEAEPIVFGR